MGLVFFSLLAGAVTTWVMARARAAASALAGPGPMRPSGGAPPIRLPELQPKASWPAIAAALVGVLEMTRNSPQSAQAQAAVLAYQQSVGLAADGIYTAKVRDSVMANLSVGGVNVTAASLPTPWSLT